MNIPAVPADVQTCATSELTDPPDRKLSEAETERYWKQNRYEFKVVKGCLVRIVCQQHETRRNIGGVTDEPVCVDDEKDARPQLAFGTWRKKK